MTVNKFNLPDVGEGLTEAEIVSWKVKAGDTVAVNDVLCEIETAKSLVELPSPFAGTVTELLVPEGVTVDVGTPIISVSDADARRPGRRRRRRPPGGRRPGRHRCSPAPAAPMYGKLEADTSDAGEPAGRPAGGPLVGSGPKADAVKRRRRISPVGRAPAVPAGPRARAPAATAAPGSRRTTSGSARTPSPPGRTDCPAAPTPLTRARRWAGPSRGLVSQVLAKPPVRKIARDLGIDLADVVPTGARGEVTREDLVSYQAQRDAEVDQADSFWGKSGRPQEQRIERIPVKGVRKATAKAMVESAFAAPHVSIFVDVDASRTMEFVKRLKASRDFEGIKVSPLLILAKAVIWAAARNPSVNATWVDTRTAATRRRSTSSTS